MEATFVLLVFLVTLIGIFDMAQIFFIQQTFVERARNAARYGAVRTYDPAVIRNMVLYNQPAAPEGEPPGFMGLTAAMISVSHPDIGTNDERLTVTISGYPFKFLSPLIAGTFMGRTITASQPYEAK